MKQQVQKIFIFISILIGIDFLFSMFLEIPKKDLIKNNQYYPLLRWGDFFESDKNSIDLVFLGSSHCYRSFVPNVFDSVLSVNSFNLGSASQTPLTSYYVLKEALTTQKPKIAVLELSWFNLVDNNKIVGLDNNQFSNAYYNLEFFENTSNKAEFILKGFGYKDYPYLLSPTIRYRNNWVQAINSVMLGKPVKKDNEEYSHKGYVISHKIAKPESFFPENAIYLQYDFSEEKVMLKLKNSIDDIISLCKQNDIELYFVTAPVAPSTFSQMANYSSIHNFFENIARENNIDYVDYNLLSPYLFNDSMFKDDNHLNNSGAVLISRHFSKYLHQKQQTNN